jgi:hypothetical protein
MSYKWKPNAAQKADYIAKLQERSKHATLTTTRAIRTGCKVEFFSANTGKAEAGTIVAHSYGADRGQHTFTILLTNGLKHFVKGRNLYPNIIKHEPGLGSRAA